MRNVGIKSPALSPWAISKDLHSSHGPSQREYPFNRKKCTITTLTLSQEVYLTNFLGLSDDKTNTFFVPVSTIELGWGSREGTPFIGSYNGALFCLSFLFEDGRRKMNL